MSPTGEGKANVIIKHGNFADSSWILKLKRRLLFYSENDDILATDSYLPQS